MNKPRLIDANELLKIMEVTYLEIRDKERDTLAHGFTTVADIIEAMPTAYDVTSVVEQLEEKSYYFGSAFSVNDGIERKKVIGLDTAIEIVKGDCDE